MTPNRPKKTARRPAKNAPQTESLRHRQILIVGIGASAGGLEAFTRLLKQLSPDTGMAFVLVQHLDPAHESALTQILTRTTTMPVLEVKNNLEVRPNHVYIIPPNTSMGIVTGVLKLTKRDTDRIAHRSIDMFFEALAHDQGERAVGIVLSGTATDGTLGLEAIKAEGGITFAQDESAKYDSMPRSAIAAGCVDLVLPPDGIARELARMSRHPYVAAAPTGETVRAEQEREADQHTSGALASGGRTPPTGAQQARAEAARPGRQGGEENAFKKVLLLLRNHCGVDFSLYKSSTIRRRITRRVVLNGHESLDQYAVALRGNSKELDALYSDVLISVTSFFRNPDSFEALKRVVFPKVLQRRSREGAVRVWTLGCSTGQEAYSIAMAYSEFAERVSPLPRLQVFATDLNEGLLEKARQGLYTKALAQDISPERLRRFFIEEEGGYRISKSLREQVVFARQNVVTDPPFSRLDLISCRNLLIYLESGLQQTIIPAFHYALKPGGFLFLGASESIGQFGELFSVVDQKHKIFSKKPIATPNFRLPLPDRTLNYASFRVPALGIRGRPESSGIAEPTRREFDALRESDRALLGLYAPPSVLVNEDFQILQFRGPTGMFLEPPAGRASFDILKMAREGLMLPLRGLLNTAKRTNKAAR
ncbi:MAG TPA: chemotaxis protein CheB, partial [Solirubrobacteraceae bacterium]